MIHATHSTPASLPRCRGTAADSAVLQLVTQRVRILGDYQVAGTTLRSARLLMRRLETKGLLTLRTVMALPELSLKGPVFCWTPGDPPPNAERIAWTLSSRWIGKPRCVLVGTATLKARLELGGCIGGRPVRRTEVSHDLHVTALYLKLCFEKPEQARRWRHEDADRSGRKGGDLVPDAMIGETALEFGGRYRAAKIRLIHRGHVTACRPYELW